MENWGGTNGKGTNVYCTGPMDTSYVVMHTSRYMKTVQDRTYSTYS
jgi:hypothetical protein